MSWRYFFTVLVKIKRIQKTSIPQMLGTSYFMRALQWSGTPLCASKNRQKTGAKAKFNWKNTMAQYFYKNPMIHWLRLFNLSQAEMIMTVLLTLWEAEHFHIVMTFFNQNGNLFNSVPVWRIFFSLFERAQFCRRFTQQWLLSQLDSSLQTESFSIERHTGLISCKSFQTTTLQACITLKIQSLRH